jgi:hypothetical protein
MKIEADKKVAEAKTAEVNVKLAAAQKIAAE